MYHQLWYQAWRVPKCLFLFAIPHPQGLLRLEQRWELGSGWRQNPLNSASLGFLRGPNLCLFQDLSACVPGSIRDGYEADTITDGPGNGGAAEKGSECLTGEESGKGFQNTFTSTCSRQDLNSGRNPHPKRRQPPTCSLCLHQPINKKKKSMGRSSSYMPTSSGDIQGCQRYMQILVCIMEDE